MGGQIVMDDDFTSARFIKDIDLNSVAERCFAIGNQVRNILQIRAAADYVICNVVPDMLDHAVVSYHNIVESSVENSAVLPDSTCQCEDFFE